MCSERRWCYQSPMVMKVIKKENGPRDAEMEWMTRRASWDLNNRVARTINSLI
jgi:hypothetical protein